MTAEEYKLIRKRLDILHKLGFERHGDLCKLNFIRTIAPADIIGNKSVGEIGGLIVTVNLDDMKIYLRVWLFWKGLPFEKTHDIPQKVMDNEKDFTDWITGIIKEDTENANPAN